MKKHTFVVIAYAPEGVSASEIADHLADASRSMSREYADSDPLRHMPDIQVHGIIRASEMPSARSVRECPEMTEGIRIRS